MSGQVTESGWVASGTNRYPVDASPPEASRAPRPANTTPSGVSRRATVRYSCPHSRQNDNGTSALVGSLGTTCWYRVVMCRTAVGSRLTYTLSPLDRNWCNRNANNGGSDSRGRTRDPACNTALIASCACPTDVPASAASRTAASGTRVGRRRTNRPVSGSVSRPNADSTHTANGSAANASNPAGGSAPIAAASWVAVGWGPVVARRSVSAITRSGATSEPNSRVATSATTRARSARVPVEAIVADVPTHCRSGASHAWRSRRTNSATSAPCRPR